VFLGASKWRADGDDLARTRRQTLGHLARADAAQAPANQTDRCAVQMRHVSSIFCQAVEPMVNIALWPGVQSTSPVERVATQVFAKTFQRGERLVIGGQARKDHHRVAIAAGKGLFLHPLHVDEFQGGAPRLGTQEQKGRR